MSVDSKGHWFCCNCHGTDNQTAFHNAWRVTLDGEKPSDIDPALGEGGEAFSLEFEVCDSCARSALLPAALLSQALMIELDAMRLAEETLKKERANGG